MKKYLLVLFIVLVFSTLVFGVATVATVGMSNTSGGGTGTNSIQAGGAVYISGTASNLTLAYQINNVYNGDTGSTIVGDLYLTYWSQTPNSDYTGSIYGPSVTLDTFAGSGPNQTTFTADFTMPTTGIPSNTLYITIYLGLEERNRGNYGYGAVIESDVDVTSAPTGYFTRLDYTADTSTEAPTLDLPLSNATIGASFDLQYDQPETAYASTVKITLTRTAGSADTESPHVLEVDSEASDTDILLNIKGDGLGGATGVSLFSGGNLLVTGSIYTIRIEYQDLAQNPIAYDEHYGITYDSGALLEVSGSDYNAGTSFSPGSTDNAFFRIQMQKSISGGEDATVSSIEFALDLGTFQSSDVDAIRIWRSTNNSSFESGTDILIASDTSSPFDPFNTGTISESIGGAAPVYYFLTIDVSSTASGTDEIGARIIEAADISASITVSGNFPITGSTHPLPVTLTSFNVVLSDQPVIHWVTQSETNNAYWNIYRGISQNLGQTIQINYGDMIFGQGTVTEPTTYSYMDNFPVLENTTYWYWLECVDNAGEADILGPVSLFIPEGNGNNGTPATPDDYGLKQNFPNPFNPDTMIKFALDEDSPVQLTIYNIKGEKIKTIFEGSVPADIIQTAYWNGKDKSGKDVATGVYLYRLMTNKTKYIKRMLLMK